MRLLALSLLLAVTPTTVIAQSAGTHDGLIVGWASNLIAGTSHILQLDRSNAAYPLISTSVNSSWPYWAMPANMTTEVDNETVVMPAFLDLQMSRLALLRWDPRTRTIVGTLWTGPRGPTINGWTNLTIDSNGDIVTVDDGRTPSALATFDRMSGTWRSTALQGSNGNDGRAGVVWDKARGGFLHAGGLGTLHLYRADLHATNNTLVARSPREGYRWGGDLAGNGDWISAHGNGVAEVKANTSAVTLPITGAPLFVIDDVTHEKWAAPGRGFYAVQPRIGGTVISGGIFYVDPARSPTTIVQIMQSKAQLPNDWPASEVLPLHQRDLVTVRTGKATWDVQINPAQAALAGKPFILAASLSGARPPVRLPDGRELYIAPDALTQATSVGPLPPFLTGNIGALSARGRGTTRLDFRSVGQALNGVTLHLCGVVLDRSAPSGIGWVLDPWAFVIDVQQ